MESVYCVVRTESLYKTDSFRLYKVLTIVLRYLRRQIKEDINKMTLQTEKQRIRKMKQNDNPNCIFRHNLYLPKYAK